MASAIRSRCDSDRIGDGAVFRDHQIDDTRWICQVDLSRARIATLCDAGIDGGQDSVPVARERVTHSRSRLSVIHERRC